MKVNPAFVSILIIATSFGYTLVHLYLAITLALGRSELGSFMAHTPSPQVSPLVVMRQSEMGLLSRPSHLL